MTRRRQRKSEFAQALMRVRKERGCTSAYSFYHGNGGKRKFGFTYHYYLLIEQGARLPSPKFLARILELMGVKGVAFHAVRRELCILYLREFSDGEPLFDPLFEPAPAEASAPAPESAPEPAASPAEELLRATARRRVSDIPHMTPEQYEAVNSSPAALWTFQLLLQSGRARTLEQLSHELALPNQELLFTLHMLQEHKLVQKKKDAYSCKYFESDLFGPVEGMAPGRANWVGEQIQKRVQAHPEEYFYPHFFMVVEDRRGLATLGQMFNETMRRAYLARPTRPVRSGTLVSVEARIGPLVTLGRE